MSYKIFVYGSLKQGLSNNWILRSSKFLNTLECTGHRIRSIGRIPIIEKTDNPEDIVVGEVYEVDTAEKDNIDYFESTAAYYPKLVPGHEDIIYYYNKHYDFDSYPLIPRTKDNKYNWSIEHQKGS